MGGSSDPVEQTVEIQLEPEVLGVICRRGRRRLRDIQASSSATLKLDRCRGALQVRGTEDAVADVQRQLQMLTGPSVQVTAAVWAELMRTRTNTNPAEAGVARIQQQSGCRIHIERSALEIRLFGPQDSIRIAQHLIQELHSMCVESRAKMDQSACSDVDRLQLFAQEFGVTLQVEEGGQICVLGILGAVDEAVNGLQSYSSMQFMEGSVSNVARTAILTAIANLIGDDNEQSNEEAAPTLDGAVTTIPPVCKPPQPQQQQQQSRMREKQMSEWTSAPQNFSNFANFCVNCGSRIERVNGVVPKFCVYCGQPTEKGEMQRGPRTNNHMQRGQYMPDMSYGGDQMQAMPMQFQQQNGNYNSPSVMQTQEGTMLMCFPMQNAPSNDRSTGLTLGGYNMGNMLAPRQWVTNMMPMSFASME